MKYKQTPYNVVGRKMIIDIKGTLVNGRRSDACCGFVGWIRFHIATAAEDDPKMINLRVVRLGGQRWVRALSNQVSLLEIRRVTYLAAEQCVQPLL